MQKVGPFTTIADKDKITLERGGAKLVFSPSELYSVTKLLSTAMAYCAGRVLPPVVQWDQFQVCFAEDGNHILSRINTDEGVVVTESDGDDLIKLLGTTLSTHVDSVRLTGGPRRGVSSVVAPEPIILGRE